MPKKNKSKIYDAFFILVIIILIIILKWDTIAINLAVFFTLNRGIISQNCFWWTLNDYLTDSTGVEVYTRLKKRGRFVPVSILGKEIYLLTDINDIGQLLELSPNPFGPGIFKVNFFSTFMPENIGISQNPQWQYKRQYNDRVLEIDTKHSMSDAFDSYILEVFSKNKPKNFEEFTHTTRQLTSKIIFGTYEYNPIIYKIFKQADSVLSARFNYNSVNSQDLAEFRTYMKYQLENPSPNTLLYLANKHHKLVASEYLIDQIPHWVFPIAGIFAVHLPRLLVFLSNHPDKLAKVIAEINDGTYDRVDTYIRKCILELFRCNNAVNSTFRGITEPFTFNNSNQIFPSGTQFVFFNNPVLRDLFETPNEYIPERWDLALENTISALMFNQGNQRCPGKELTISLLTSGLVIYLQLNNNEIKTNIVMDRKNVPYIINPCKIEFN